MDERTILDDLAAALARRNSIADPMVAPIGLEVRTSIGFTLKGADLARQVLAERPGCDAIRVVWEWRCPPDSLNDLLGNLLSNERDLMARTVGGPVRYLGTYLVKERPDDPPLFVTSWGCPDAETARPVAAGPWDGPAGAVELYRFTFGGLFDHARAERITSQGLAAATAL